MKLDCPLIVIDCETTGLHPARNQVLSLGMVIINRHLVKTMRAEWKINMEHPSEILRKEYRSAQKVHKIGTWDALFGGWPLEDVIQELEWVAAAYPDALVAGNQSYFDYSFVTRMFEMVGKKNPFDYHTVDLTALGAVHLGVVGLKSIMLAVGLDPTKFTQHNALADAEATADALIALLKMLQKEDEEKAALLAATLAQQKMLSELRDEIENYKADAGTLLDVNEKE